MPVPTAAEQRAIVAYLDEACGRIDALITKAERAITLLRERRTALISAAVTGKIDVRGEVTGLDEAPDPVGSRCGDSTGGSGGRNLEAETR